MKHLGLQRHLVTGNEMMPTSPNDIEEMNDPEFTDSDHDEPPPRDIVAYSELRSCADLFRMHEEGILEIKPEFQRDVVWPSSHQTRFIDSLIKQLPIPSMCLALDYTSDRWIVIDGLQRMATIIRFLRGEDWKLSKLDDVNKAISGKNAATIKNDKGQLRRYFSRIQNQSLPINVLRCNFGKRQHMEYLFTIFHRLNAGGIKLNNQEIRNCIYGGSLNDLLATLDQRSHWRKLNRMTKRDSNYRFVKQELILRYFAFLDNPEKYKGRIAKFLNEYMYENRNADETFVKQKEAIFERTVLLLSKQVFPNGPSERIPTNIMETILVAISQNIAQLEQLSQDELKSRYEELRHRSEFSPEAVAEGLAKVKGVKERFDAARQVFFLSV